MGRYIEKDNPKAEELFERLIGYQFAKSLQTEEHKFEKKTNHQIQLKLNPIELESCEGHVKFDPMQFNGWVEIPLCDINIKGRVLDIPPSIFGSSYESIKVKYHAGETEIPQDVVDVVTEISNLLSLAGMGAWNISLSPNALEVINYYRK